MNKIMTVLVGTGLAVALWRWLAPRSNTQVHRINQH
jgi:hypothetical protein